jgi:hypothetical protein
VAVTTPPEIKEAVRIMNAVWMAKEDNTTHRFKGPRKRWYREKANAPRQKARIATRDFTHVYLGASEGRSLTPRPAKIVLPDVCVS